MLVLEFIGIVINFIELVFSIQLNWLLKVTTYVFSVIIPAIILWIEKAKNTECS